MLIELSFNTLVWIDDSTTIFGFEYAKAGKLDMDDFGSESLRSRGSSAAILGSSKKFILKIGGALLQLTEEKKDFAEVDLDEKEAWLLRELAQSPIMVGKEAVGMNLKLKVHALLRSFAAQETLEDMGFKDSKEHNIKETEIQDKFIQWREKENVE